jgi:hypothetical protein
VDELRARLAKILTDWDAYIFSKEANGEWAESTKRCAKAIREALAAQPLPAEGAQPCLKSDWGYQCNEHSGHVGWHVARGTYGDALYCWPQVAATPPATAASAREQLAAPREREWDEVLVASNILQEQWSRLHLLDQATKGNELRKLLRPLFEQAERYGRSSKMSGGISQTAANAPSEPLSGSQSEKVSEVPSHAAAERQRNRALR